MPHVRVTTGRVAKLCDFGLARRVGSPSCTVSPERERTLALRWTAPEVFQEHLLTTHADLWYVVGSGCEGGGRSEKEGVGVGEE